MLLECTKRFQKQRAEEAGMLTTSTMRIRPNFSENTLLKVLAVSYACVWIWAAINPVYPADWIQEWLGFSRNHFDRVVHFSFGLLMAYPIREIFLRVAHTKGFFAYYLPFDVTLAFSGAYEIIEMLVAVIVSPGAGDAYLGTQGDVWDAQKDMGLAAFGAVLCMVVTATVRSIRKKPHTPDYSSQP